MIAPPASWQPGRWPQAAAAYAALVDAHQDSRDRARQRLKDWQILPPDYAWAGVDQGRAYALACALGSWQADWNHAWAAARHDVVRGVVADLVLRALSEPALARHLLAPDEQAVWWQAQRCGVAEPLDGAHIHEGMLAQACVVLCQDAPAARFANWLADWTQGWVALAR